MPSIDTIIRHNDLLARQGDSNNGRGRQNGHMMRIGILGGSFDPVHHGHLLLAESAREQCRLDQVRFVPAAVPPHKQSKILAPAKARVEMLELAIAGHEAFLVSHIELDRQGVSYTVETLAEIHAEHPDAELHLLLGADMFFDLPTWRQPERICELAIPTVVSRPDSPEPDYGILRELASPARIAVFENTRVTMPLVEYSSTEIRRRVVEGLSIRFHTPRAVEQYILSNSLYCNGDETK